MSAPFTQNRHHLLLAEAHQLNEFLDARLIGAEVPEDQRLAVARDVLELAMVARCGGYAFAVLPQEKGREERRLHTRSHRPSFAPGVPRGYHDLLDKLLSFANEVRWSSDQAAAMIEALGIVPDDHARRIIAAYRFYDGSVP